MRADIMDAARKCDPGQLFCSARCVLTALGRQRPALRQGIDRILPDEALAAPRLARAAKREIGRASCRERVCQYVSISVVTVSIQNTTEYNDPSKRNT